MPSHRDCWHFFMSLLWDATFGLTGRSNVYVLYVCMCCLLSFACQLYWCWFSLRSHFEITPGMVKILRVSCKLTLFVCCYSHFDIYLYNAYNRSFGDSKTKQNENHCKWNEAEKRQHKWLEEWQKTHRREKWKKLLENPQAMNDNCIAGIIFDNKSSLNHETFTSSAESIWWPIFKALQGNSLSRSIHSLIEQKY